MTSFKQASLALLIGCVAWPTASIAGSLAYITNFNSDTVSVIDTSTNTVTATIPVGNGPLGVAVNTVENTAFVGNDFSHDISVIDINTNTVTATIPVGAVPNGIAVDPIGHRVFVALQSSDTVSIINTFTNTLTASIPVGHNPIGIAVSPDGNTALVANFSDNTVSAIDTTTNTIKATIDVGAAPRGIAISPSGTLAYVTQGGDVISIINMTTNAVATAISISGSSPSPYGVAVDPSGSTVYVTNTHQNTMSIIDTATNTVTATVPVGSSPHGVAVDPTSANVFVANFDGNTVSVVSTATNTVTATIPVGNGPLAFGAFISSSVPDLACAGFAPPFDRALSLKNKNKRVIPVDIVLTDADGYIVTDFNITAPPVINVLFDGTTPYGDGTDSEELLPVGSANEDNLFRYDPDTGQWIYNLGTKQFGAAGTYKVTVASGDELEYTIATPDGACSQTFERLN